MEKLPPEIFEMIIPQIGSCAFISLRNTCKRLKMLVDHMEMTLKPCIWYRYTFEEFSLPCIKSLLPWLKGKTERFEENNLIWKTVYSCLYESKKHHRIFICKQANLDHEFGHVSYISFRGQQLFLFCSHVAICAGIFDKNKCLMPITGLRHFNKHSSPIPVSFEVLDPSLPINDTIVYKPFNIGDQTSPFVECCKQTFISTLSNHFNRRSGLTSSWLGSSAAMREARKRLHIYAFEKNYFTNWTIEMYDAGILLAAFHDKLLFCGHDSCDSEIASPIKFSCGETTLPGRITTIHRLGNMIIILVSGVVFTNLLQLDVSGKITFGDWKTFSLSATATGYDSEVCNIAVLGLTFAAITIFGKVYLSTVGELCHDWIQRNLRLVYELQEPPLKRTFYNICLDVNDGLVIGVLDTNKNITLLLSE